MSAVDHALHWTGATGSWEADRREYTAVYHVWTDDPLDGPKAIIDYFYAHGLAVLGSSYSYGHDSDPWAYCVKMDPQRADRSAKQWSLVLSYETRDREKEQGRDKNGDPTDDPLQFHSELDVGKAQFQSPVERAWNETRLPGRAVGTLGAVTNSAGTVFDPPLMRDRSDMVYRITKYMDHFPDSTARQYLDAINSAAWTLTLRFQQFTATFFRHEAKLQNLGGTFHARVIQLANGQPKLQRFWKNTYEIHSRDGGWIEEVVDRGLHAKAGLGDPDGRGGIIGFKPDGSAMNNQEMAAAFPPGTPPVRRLTDFAGQPIDEPVLLDLQGQPLAAGQAAKYIRYRTLNAYPFHVLGISD